MGQVTKYWGTKDWQAFERAICSRHRIGPLVAEQFQAPFAREPWW